MKKAAIGFPQRAEFNSQEPSDRVIGHVGQNSSSRFSGHRNEGSKHRVYLLRNQTWREVTASHDLSGPDPLDPTRELFQGGKRAVCSDVGDRTFEDRDGRLGIVVDQVGSEARHESVAVGGREALLEHADDVSAVVWQEKRLLGRRQRLIEVTGLQNAADARDGILQFRAGPKHRVQHRKASNGFRSLPRQFEGDEAAHAMPYHRSALASQFRQKAENALCKTRNRRVCKGKAIAEAWKIRSNDAGCFGKATKLGAKRLTVTSPSVQKDDRRAARRSCDLTSDTADAVLLPMHVQTRSNDLLT